MAAKTKSASAEEEKIARLRESHKIYDDYFDEWVFLSCAYEGVAELIGWGVLTKHERETTDNHEYRESNAYGFSYSKSVVDIFNSYLFKKEFVEKIPEKLANDELFQAFRENCDQEETPFNEFFIDQQRKASIEGHVGILVDRPDVKAQNKKEEIDQGMYPYLVAYMPTNIIDWKWERDKITGKKTLVHLKLLDDDNHYRVWTPDTWEVWEIVDADGSDSSELRKVSTSSVVTKNEVVGRTAQLINSGKNTLGVIPWVWLYNQKSTKVKDLGVSDITDVARIDASIIRNLSQIEEVIDLAAFPMMRVPKPEAGGGDTDDEVGPSAVLEFDPEYPEAKPDWLSSEVEGPVGSIISLIGKKVAEIYRSSNIGGMSATEMSKDAKSGVALRTEFQLLNSKLVKKARNVAKAKRKCVDFWLKWQGLSEDKTITDELRFDYPTTFELDDLATDLGNIMTSKVIVNASTKYKQEIQKAVVRWILPTAEDDVISEIDKEIEEFDYEAAALESLNNQFGFEKGDDGKKQAPIKKKKNNNKKKTTPSSKIDKKEVNKDE